MPESIVTSPDGQKFKVTHPEGASQADIIAYAQKNFAPKSGPDLASIPGWQQGGPSQAPGAPRGIMARIKEGAVGGFGESRITPEERAAYPRSAASFGALELPGRLLGGAMGAGAGLIAGLAETPAGPLYPGISPAEADRLQRDIPMLGTAAAIEAGTGRPGTMPKTQIKKAEPVTLGKIERTIGQPRTPEEAGIAIEKGVREAQRAQQRETSKRYKLAYAQPGEFSAGAFEGVGSEIKGRMAQSPSTIVDDLTPQTAKAIAYLDRTLSQLRIENKVGLGQPVPAQGNIVGINLRGIEQVRKNLNDMRGDISPVNKSDRRTFKILMNELDKKIEKTIEDGLFSGNRAVLDMIRGARQSASKGFQLYGPAQKGDSVTATMAKIVGGKKSPQSIANMLINASRVGARDLAEPVVKRLSQVLREDEMHAVREAVFTAAKTQKSGLRQLYDTRFGRELFDPYQRDLMRRFDMAKELGTKAKLNGMIGRALTSAVVHKVTGPLGPVLKPMARGILKAYEKPSYGGTSE